MPVAALQPALKPAEGCGGLRPKGVVSRFEGRSARVSGSENGRPSGRWKMENRVPRHIHRVGVSRRELLQVGFLGAFGMWMSDALDPLQALAHAATPRGAVQSRAKSVILVWMPGGPPQMQLWDLKPD